MSGNRRAFIASAAGAALAGSLSARAADEVKRSPGAFRFAFLPCIHFRPDLNSPEGLAKALEAVEALDPAVDFILTGGDLCHNLRDETLESSSKRADAFVEIWKSKTGKETFHCLGNHDLAAWNDKSAATDPRYGKGLLRSKLAMKSPFYGFDRHGWRFIVLDYLKENGPGNFSPEISADQLTWLEAEVAAHRDRPMMIVTHAPFIAAFEALTDRGVENEKGRMTPNGRIVSNLPAVLQAVEPGNVQAFISGHLHTVEEIQHHGVRFINAGSVSGQQWTGPRLGFAEGFGVFDCRADGTFDFEYRTFGWTAAKASPSR